LSHFLVLRRSLHALHRRGRQIVSAQVWLQLLKEDQYQSHFIFFVEVLDRSFLNFLQIEVHIFVTVKDVWSLVENVVKELSHEESSSLVLFARKVHFVLELNVV